MGDIVDFRKPELLQPETPMKPWEWLRWLADRVEKEADDATMKPPQMVLVFTNHDAVGADFRLRAERYGCSKIEVVGMLHTAAHDYLAD